MSTPPHLASPFIGRRQELSEVRQALSHARLVTLTGIGGAGKTRLALELAASAHRSYSDVWVVELADILDTDLVGLAVVERVGLQPRPGSDPVAQLAELVDGRRALLVLDNCEQVLGACRDIAARLLQRCPRLRVLTTSRQPLGVAGEVVYPVPPLALPDRAGQVPLQAAAESEAVRLFVDRAGAAMPGFALNDDNGDAVAQLCMELEGLPLALELAAARIRVLSPQAMLERLRDRYRLLSRGFLDAPSRHRSLHASVDWSHDLCSPRERLLWARLSVFAGGFTLEAAEHVCSGLGLPAEEVLDVLSDLVDKSLVVRDPTGGRFRMLETIRQYGAERLDESRETGRVRDLRREWYGGLALRLGAEWMGPDQPRLVERWRRDHANLWAVLEESAPAPRTAESALVLVMALEGYWMVTGLLAEARHWLELALAQDTGAPALRAQAMSMSAYLGSIQGDEDHARRRLADGAALLADCTDPAVLGYVAFATAGAHLFAGRTKPAVEAAGRCAELCRQTGDRNHLAVGLFVSGLCHGVLGDRAAATAEMTRCLAMTEECGEHYTRALALWWLGLGARDLGNLQRAAHVETRAFMMKWALNDQPGIAIVLEALASVAARAAVGPGEAASDDTPDGTRQDRPGETAESPRDAAERAATLLGAAAAIWQYVLTAPVTAPFLAQQRTGAERSARAVLGDQAFVTAHRRGWALSPEEVLALVLHSEGGPAPASAEGPRDAGTTASPEPEHPGSSGTTPLTRRESEVAALVSAGHTNQQIAGRLGISVRTAEGHVENILRKLSFTSRAQVAAWVAGGGLGEAR